MSTNISLMRGPPAGPSRPPTAPPEAVTEDEPLQNEADNQENVLSQLLGDYDKVKAVSEGSNCQCKCVVRPLGRGACQRINEGTFKAEDFYTVETITSGPDCKCACVAPPSALNPCEGDFRLKKLREAESSDLKLSSIIDMLENAFYGLDLLKLHSVTTKLIGRVEKLEEEVSKNFTQESNSVRGNVDEVLSERNKRHKENCSDILSNSLPDIGSSLQRDAAAAYTHAEGKYEERFLQDETISQQINSVESLQELHATPEEEKPKQLLQRKLHVRSKIPSKPTIIRGITYYKAKFTDSENDIEEQDEFFSGDNTVDLLIEDQLLRHNDNNFHSFKRKSAPLGGPPELTDIDPMVGYSTQPTPATVAPATATLPLSSEVTSPSTQPTPPLTTEIQLPTVPENTTVKAAIVTSEPVDELASWPATTRAQISTPVPTTSENMHTTNTDQPTAAITTTMVQTSITAETSTAATMSKESSTTVQVTAPPTPTSSGLPATPKQTLEEEDVRNIIGRCKDTLSTISGPITQNTYGRNEGAWMKDPLAKEERIYVTNYYYGNTLVEFRNLENFKQGRWSNSYKLPYSWIGTGHAVYNGSFYYNRAFTRNIIKYNLKQRYVAAWAMLHDVAYEESTPWRWRGHSDVDFAVDENGLWVVYPAINYDGFNQEVIVLSKLNAMDLSTQKETTWRTGLRKNFYGNCFVICGVLYAVDSYNKKNANISYAFDTHTNTQIIPRLLFENEYSYTTQIDYNPKDRLLYAWDNGHQVTYHVIFAY
ncbi:PREDICTED: olfactomedin-like protein 2B [Crocodylus porosus]|uniref:olfactomedin-like protein 2B n=1 Tax=Crocodylus porosus TaxID=8502 RepID=UPI00093C7F1B|nr:PREDICTED: olfactomedin-like protein 2B [Crocodylus porosus]